ncbi:hypothetical protein CEXT_670391 [Caerostris extrusa]|uniref:Uncharacterized protein n=1 Tax=Caerostris extrusa TaxID=172846 RepID=A0AAV4WHJ6_CAEEX|nr:hypothetical protein CEXT_670391 [Caerostris extrusa]
MGAFACLGRHPRADRPPAQLPAGPAESQPDDSTVFHVSLHPVPSSSNSGFHDTDGASLSLPPPLWNPHHHP